MSRFTPKQVAEILELPIGRSYHITDPVVLDERKKIHEKYHELFYMSEPSLEARAWWISENLRIL